LISHVNISVQLNINYFSIFLVTKCCVAGRERLLMLFAVYNVGNKIEE